MKYLALVFALFAGVCNAQTPLISASFMKILNTTGYVATLDVVRSSKSLAETDGQRIIVDRMLEVMTEGERQFAIAHELGHIAFNHREHKLSLLTKHRVNRTDKNMVWLEKRALSHANEFEADDFAYRAMLANGWTHDGVVQAMLGLMRNGPDTDEHPSTFRRVKRLGTK